MQAPIETDVEVDDAVVIQCPKKGYDLAKVSSACAQCKFLEGFVRVSESGNWSQRYRVFCGHPVARRTQMVAEQ